MAWHTLIGGLASSGAHGVRPENRQNLFHNFSYATPVVGIAHQHTSQWHSS
ncbi:hypothetical protein [Coleofasciculus chthonoplastes]|uniref:hypothetical protein n=1 Tax=Coleofasciculus TaxID=669368 RepID=UPI0032F4C54E